jgi:hypothetical protein
VTVTVQAPPNTAQAQPPPQHNPAVPAWVTQYDQQFLAKLQSEGWTITNPVAMTRNAHLVCAAFERGVPPESVNSDLMANALMSMTEAALFSSAAMLTYPNCP